jgi:mono/diheme cytochrome c family protein
MKEIRSPIDLASQMWNHGEVMMTYAQSAGIPMPKFKDREFAHLAEYITKTFSRGFKQQNLMPIGNPRRGKNLFQEKRCMKCHAINGEGGTIGPDLAASPLRKGVMEIAGKMWNHAPTMWSTRKIIGEEPITLTGHEMADIISYLYFLGFSTTSGNPDTGREIFARKGCSICHSVQPTRHSAAPDLTQFPRNITPTRMIQLMWNHTPIMENMMTRTNVPWPVLTAKDMQDLYSYLSRVTEKK